ncbi:MAG: hypothetical protein WCG47_03835 [Dermatophilaceae bacterium]
MRHVDTLVIGAGHAGLLTPSWMTRLPGWSYGGTDPDGYLTPPARCLTRGAP